MSSSTSAIKASKSIVESYVSSNSERSDLTTSFTSHSSATDVDNNSIVNKIMVYIQHPKFKWVVIALLLCIFAFIYFKTQSKPVKKNVKENPKKDNLNVKLNKNGHPELVEKDKPVAFGFKDKELQQKIEQLDNKQQQLFLQQMAQKMNQHMAHQHMAHPQMMQPQQMQPQQMQPQQMQPQKTQSQNNKPAEQAQNAPPQQVDSESSDESEEVFIENENIMNHNLTMEEMNAIDKQLEDVIE